MQWRSAALRRKPAMAITNAAHSLLQRRTAPPLQGGITTSPHLTCGTLSPTDSHASGGPPLTPPERIQVSTKPSTMRVVSRGDENGGCGVRSLQCATDLQRPSRDTRATLHTIIPATVLPTQPCPCSLLCSRSALTARSLPCCPLLAGQLLLAAPALGRPNGTWQSAPLHTAPYRHSLPWCPPPLRSAQLRSGQPRQLRSALDEQLPALLLRVCGAGDRVALGQGRAEDLKVVAALKEQRKQQRQRQQQGRQGQQQRRQRGIGW